MIGAARPLFVRSRGIVGVSFLAICGWGQWGAMGEGCPSGGDAGGRMCPWWGATPLMI